MRRGRDGSGSSAMLGGPPMSGFRKRKPAPPVCPAKPGIGVSAKVAFSTGDRSWTEEVDLVRIATDVFWTRGYSVTNQKSWLLHGDSGFLILPQLVGIQPLEDGGAQTVT